MPCFSFKPTAAQDKMVDIERLLIDYAWREIAATTFFDRLLRSRRYTFEVNWSYLDISHRLVEFKIQPRDGQRSGSDGVDEVRSKILQRDLCLFRTWFTNSSPSRQTFMFKTEKKTTSRCDISLQKGFRLGANVNVKVSVPVPGQEGVKAAGLEAPGITGSLSGELNVTKSTGQTFEETLTWGVDSQVEVEKESRVMAELMMRESKLAADFEVESVIKVIGDSVIPVYMKDRKTSRILQLLQIPKNKLADILTEGNGFSSIGNDKTAVSCKTNGTYKAVYGAEQIIKIEKLNARASEEPSSGSGVEAVGE